jgi:hypothetical protein
MPFIAGRFRGRVRKNNSGIHNHLNYRAVLVVRRHFTKCGRIRELRGLARSLATMLTTLAQHICRDQG